MNQPGSTRPADFGTSEKKSETAEPDESETKPEEPEGNLDEEAKKTKGRTQGQFKKRRTKVDTVITKPDPTSEKRKRDTDLITRRLRSKTNFGPRIMDRPP